LTDKLKYWVFIFKPTLLFLVQLADEYILKEETMFLLVSKCTVLAVLHDQ
jgi:hypothetical protein